MLSRHWRLWLSFPSPGPPPEERLAFELCGSFSLIPPERMCVSPIYLAVVTAADSSLCGGSLLAALPIKPPLKGVRSPTPHGRGGSVSRRDHNQATGPRTNLSGGTNEAEAAKPNASRSSGGSAREELLSEKLPPSHTPVRFLSLIFLSCMVGIAPLLSKRKCTNFWIGGRINGT